MAKAKKQEKSMEAALWESANKLRGNVEPAEYKHVVLSLIFLKYASDRFEERRQELIDEGKGAYVDIVEFYTQKSIFYIPENSRWSYIMSQAKQPDIALKIDTALYNIEQSNKTLKGALPDKYYSRLGLDVSKLSSLLDELNKIELTKDKEQDVMGRVYEYFLSNFALQEGKGKGEFYTPKCIVNLIAEMIEPFKGTIYDPCCGSGHMLTYAFDLLARIYEEAGFSPREIPSLILKNNLHGIEIDPRAGELAAFALTMKAREHDSRFLRRENAPQPNICVLQNVTFDDEEFKSYMDFIGRDLFTAALQTTLRQFEKADCFGSLIVPQLADSAAVLAELESRDVSGQLFLTNIHQKVLAVIRQAEYLSPHYHVVVTNPPYMGSKGMNADLKKFAETKYSDSKSDLFAMFIERCLELVQKHGTIGMITMQSWMFLSSFEKLRTKLLDEDTILSMAHLGPRGFDTIGGEVVQTTAFTLTNTHIPDYQGAFLRLIDGNSEAEKSAMFKEAIQ